MRAVPAAADVAAAAGFSCDNALSRLEAIVDPWIATFLLAAHFCDPTSGLEADTGVPEPTTIAAAAAAAAADRIADERISDSAPVWFEAAAAAVAATVCRCCLWGEGRLHVHVIGPSQQGVGDVILFVDQIVGVRLTKNVDDG